MASIGDNVIVNGHSATVKFIGTTDFATGTWYGLELDQPFGKNNGAVQGRQYFTTSKSDGNYGLFCRAHQLQLSATQSETHRLKNIIAVLEAKLSQYIEQVRDREELQAVATKRGEQCRELQDIVEKLTLREQDSLDKTSQLSHQLQLLKVENDRLTKLLSYYEQKYSLNAAESEHILGVFDVKEENRRLREEVDKLEKVIKSDNASKESLTRDNLNTSDNDTTEIIDQSFESVSNEHIVTRLTIENTELIDLVDQQATEMDKLKRLQTLADEIEVESQKQITELKQELFNSHKHNSEIMEERDLLRQSVLTYEMELKGLKGNAVSDFNNNIIELMNTLYGESNIFDTCLTRLYATVYINRIKENTADDDYKAIVLVLILIKELCQIILLSNNVDKVLVSQISDLRVPYRVYNALSSGQVIAFESLNFLINRMMAISGRCESINLVNAIFKTLKAFSDSIEDFDLKYQIDHDFDNLDLALEGQTSLSLSWKDVGMIFKEFDAYLARKCSLPTITEKFLHMLITVNNSNSSKNTPITIMHNNSDFEEESQSSLGDSKDNSLKQRLLSMEERLEKEQRETKKLLIRNKLLEQKYENINRLESEIKSSKIETRKYLDNISALEDRVTRLQIEKQNLLKTVTAYKTQKYQLIPEKMDNNIITKSELISVKHLEDLNIVINQSRTKKRLLCDLTWLKEHNDEPIDKCSMKGYHEALNFVNSIVS